MNKIILTKNYKYFKTNINNIKKTNNKKLELVSQNFNKVICEDELNKSLKPFKIHLKNNYHKKSKSVGRNFNELVKILNPNYEQKYSQLSCYKIKNYESIDIIKSLSYQMNKINKIDKKQSINNIKKRENFKILLYQNNEKYINLKKNIKNKIKIRKNILRKKLENPIKLVDNINDFNCLINNEANKISNKRKKIEEILNRKYKKH